MSWFLKIEFLYAEKAAVNINVYGCLFCHSAKKNESESLAGRVSIINLLGLSDKEIDLLLYQNGVLSPIEIKKAASPGKNAIKNFRVLDPVSTAEPFCGLETLKVEIGTGSVVCMAADLLPLDEKNWYVPVWLI